ncbi:MAG: carbonic anhydrase [bacterium]
MASGSFATAVNCMDGRTQLPVIEWMKREHGVDYVDMITAPGADGILSRGEAREIETLKERVLISVGKHGSRVIAVAGHHDCAGNPVSREEHLADIRTAVGVVHGWNLPAAVVGLWVGDDWKAEAVEV